MPRDTRNMMMVVALWERERMGGLMTDDVK